MGALVVNGTSYEKPNMAALEGDLGGRIIEAIRTTPRPDFHELDRRCEEVKARMSEARANGTY